MAGVRKQEKETTDSNADFATSENAKKVENAISLHTVQLDNKQKIDEEKASGYLEFQSSVVL